MVYLVLRDGVLDYEVLDAGAFGVRFGAEFSWVVLAPIAAMGYRAVVGGDEAWFAVGMVQVSVGMVWHVDDLCS